MREEGSRRRGEGEGRKKEDGGRRMEEDLSFKLFFLSYILYFFKRKKTLGKGFSESLLMYITFFGTSLKLSPPPSSFCISSLSEKKVISLLEKDEAKLLKFTQKCFVRSYPKGSRIDSSNYSPIDPWNAGAQVVALNFQTNDKNLLIYLSKFSENGGTSCGYLLKPQFLRDGSKLLSDFKDPVLNLKVKIISGSQLRQIENDTNDILDPYVKVTLIGHPLDESSNPSLRTESVENNGLNPKFNKETTFSLVCPEVDMLLFEVFDENQFKNERVVNIIFYDPPSRFFPSPSLISFPFPPCTLSLLLPFHRFSSPFLSSLPPNPFSFPLPPSPYTLHRTLTLPPPPAPFLLFPPTFSLSSSSSSLFSSSFYTTFQPSTQPSIDFTVLFHFY